MDGLKAAFTASAILWIGGGLAAQISSSRNYTTMAANLHEVFVTGFGTLTIVLGIILVVRFIRRRRSNPLRTGYSDFPNSPSEVQQMTQGEHVGEPLGRKSFPTDRWQALVRYDAHLAAAAEKLRPYGEKWVHTLGHDYFTLGEDKKYLPSMVLKLKNEAEQEAQHEKAQGEANEFRQLYDGELCTEASLNILCQAKAKGYVLHVQDSKTIKATQAGIGTTYLRSNSDIRRFGQYL